MLKAFAAQYLRLIDYFIHDGLRADRDAFNQARMFLISHTMGPILGNTVPLALFLFDPTPGLDTLVLALSITGFWVFPFLLKRGFDYDRLVIASAINLSFCIFWSCYFNGGVLSPTLPWVLIIPILSFFYIGGKKRLRGKLLTIFAAAFGLFLTLYYVNNPPPNDIPGYAMTALGIVSTAAALAYVATMAIYYARIFDAGMALESEVRRRRKATDELREAILAADQAGLLKAEFLARMSHELRTPLNAVIGYSQILREEALEKADIQMQDDVDRIHDAGQYLLRLINMILDLSKIEAGRMQFSVETLSLVDLVREAVADAREAIRQNGNSLDVFIEPAVEKVETDKQRLLQILDAILDNAASFTRRGHIEVRCTVTAEWSGGMEYAVAIRDTGTGIPPERLDTLFETLSDSRDASASRYGGTGLNLTVIKKLAHAMGCDISVESTLGEGSCFTVHIPAHWAPPGMDATTDKRIEAA